MRCFKKLHHAFLHDAACRWYPVKDAAHLLWSKLARRRVEVGQEEMRALLTAREVPLETWREREEQGSVRGLAACCGEDGRWLTGGLLVGVPSEDELLCLPCVLTARCVMLHADKEDIRAAKAQLGVEEVRQARQPGKGAKRARDGGALGAGGGV